VKSTKQLFAGLFLMMSGLGTAQAEYALNLVKGVTQISNDVYDLHMLILWICVAIGVAVFGAMFYSIYFHRKSRGHEAAQFHESTKVEILWTVIPTVILISMAIPATSTLLEMDDTEDADLSIKVTGWQWKWEYEYLDNGVHFFSSLDEASNKARQIDSGIDPASVPHYLLNVDKPLVIPTKKKIRFLFTAADVLHSWWVPSLGWKKDTIPGFINEAWTYVDEPGTYRGQCAELCGKDHGFMPIVVVAMEENDYLKWVQEQQAVALEESGAVDKEWSTEELIAKGKTIYEANCASCHMPNGEGLEGMFPSLIDDPIVTGDINDEVTLVMNGKGMMPAFGKMLKAVDIAAVITYTRNGLDNHMGDAIQPAQIQTMLDEMSDAKN